MLNAAQTVGASQAVSGYVHPNGLRSSGLTWQDNFRDAALGAAFYFGKKGLVFPSRGGVKYRQPGAGRRPGEERGQRCGRMLKKFIGYYRPHVGLFAPDMVRALLIAAVDLLFPMVSRYAVQELLPHNKLPHLVLMIGAAGVGKTAYWLYPPALNMLVRPGMSFLSTDTKGDIVRNYGRIARNCYGYKVSVIDLRNPTRSNGEQSAPPGQQVYGFIPGQSEDTLLYKAKSGESMPRSSLRPSSWRESSANYGQNAYFLRCGGRVLCATILLVAEFFAPEKRHIVSVFKVIQELLAPSAKKGKEPVPTAHRTASKRSQS